MLNIKGPNRLFLSDEGGWVLESTVGENLRETNQRLRAERDRVQKERDQMQEELNMERLKNMLLVEKLATAQVQLIVCTCTSQASVIVKFYFPSRFLNTQPFCARARVCVYACVPVGRGEDAGIACPCGAEGEWFPSRVGNNLPPADTATRRGGSDWWSGNRRLTNLLFGGR